MKFVGVRHKPEHPNLFWFSVPEPLSHLVSIGKTVVCDTRKGKTTGVVVQVIEGFLPSEAAKLIGDYLPRRDRSLCKRPILWMSENSGILLS